ncbi:MAG: MBL fold metallo-hydrolase, partial [Anaerotruncus massiliensis (ex Togo et al. 2019)]
YDHIGAVRALREAFGCKLAVGRRDLEMLADRRKSLAIMRGMTDEDYLLTPDLLLGEGDAVTAGPMRFEVIDTPGHTAGGVSYKCGDLLTGIPSSGDRPLRGLPVDARPLKSRGAAGDYRVLPATAPSTSSGNAGTTP